MADSVDDLSKNYGEKNPSLRLNTYILKILQSLVVYKIYGPFKTYRTPYIVNKSIQKALSVIHWKIPVSDWLGNESLQLGT